MKKIEKITVNTFITQISFWVILSLVFPLLSSIASNTFSFKAILNSIRSLLPWMFIYFFNYFALVPFFLKPGKKWVFYLGNTAFVSTLYLLCIYRHHYTLATKYFSRILY